MLLEPWLAFKPSATAAVVIAAAAAHVCCCCLLLLKPWLRSPLPMLLQPQTLTSTSAAIAFASSSV
jgi:hypothetical protein